MRLNEKKSERQSERWKTKETFFVEGQHEKFEVALRKWEMLVAKGENEWQWKKKCVRLHTKFPS